MLPKVLLVAALLLSAIPASAQSIGAAPYVALTLGSSIDLATTLSGIHSGRAQEGNPLLSHGGTPGLVGVKSASTLGLALAMRHFAKHGHPRAAKVIGYTVGIVLAGVGYRNAQVGR
jgi:hypothetical protein